VQTIRVVEFFAGVGGFHVALSKTPGFEVVWANQWEPETKAQHAYTVLEQHFPGTPTCNRNVRTVKETDVPSHNLLVGGFPCVDYSVAKPNSSAGIEGDQGSLWFELDRIIRHHRPEALLLENVDRVLQSPGKDMHRLGDRRGRDFGVILGTLNDLGYVVEWRTINAADYGHGQRRRRVFMVCFRNDTAAAQTLAQSLNAPEYLATKGFFAQSFPCVAGGKVAHGHLGANLDEMRQSFKFLFANAGIMAHGQIATMRVDSIATPNGKTLGDVLERDVGEDYYIPADRLARWEYLKGRKDEQRKTKAGHKFHMCEGAVAFPDPLDGPSRTITKSGEGGTAADRSKHAVLDPQTNRLRVLTPLECERLQGFPDNWTQGIPESWRYKVMGNALVVGVVATIGAHLPRWMAMTVPEPVLAPAPLESGLAPMVKVGPTAQANLFGFASQA
jgi:DNA (cytosine-5)-methyltransferase 1